MTNPPSNDDKLREIARAAESARAAGRREEASRLLAQAQALAPEHPLTHNLAGLQAVHGGDAASARRHFEIAASKDDRNPAYWLNLATALRRLNLPQEELKALERVLAIEPRHLLALLQKASLLELQGKRKAAAKVYESAMHTIPPGATVHETVRPAIERAITAVRENSAALDAFLTDRLRTTRERHATAKQERFQHCIDVLLGKRAIYVPQPTFVYFPKLPAWEFYPREDFPWLDRIEAATAEIRAEFERVFAEDAGSLEPYIAYPEGVPLDQWAELNHSRRWSVFFLWRDGEPVTAHLERCPRTAELVRQVPFVDVAGYAPSVFFSILDAKSKIPPHTGVTNTRLIVHLPLIIPPGCGFRVGSETREWQPGRAWVFDDTIEHEAWNNSDVPRAILIFDIWNPNLSEAERDLVRKAVESVREFYGTEVPLTASE
jgi:aspartyl/asparaginyl beta-hydroxylase (cupin superfamily)/Tfp pilus assembly protein PilF